MSLALATKRCSKCGEVKPLSDFHKNRSNPDGLQYGCKPCVIEGVKASQERLRQEIGDEEFRRRRVETMARSRRRRESRREREYSKARGRAVQALIDLHRSEFESLMARELYEIGGSR